ncbi:MAG: 1-acyl-sn-glycerol-3-phosphate acyltransferase [Gammaproteobacteria bacterium]|nr:1-acyl-sn-glycerol-3-phosphate acyltransferase [Gammaproteobacteria bacterium]
MIRKLLQAIYGLYLWVLLLFCVVLTTLPLLLTPGPSRRRNVARHSARLLFRLAGIKVQTRGEPVDATRACIVVSNHASYLDGIILTAFLPPNFSFLVKREMRSVPIGGLLLRRLGTEFVERFDFRRGAADARRIIRTAGTGQGLAAFPEGTFRPEPGLGHFYPGAFNAAVRAGLPVIPITLLGSRKILPAEQLLPVPGKLEIIVHPAISCVQNGGRSEMIRIRDAARASILTALNEPDRKTRL